MASDAEHGFVVFEAGSLLFVAMLYMSGWLAWNLPGNFLSFFLLTVSLQGLQMCLLHESLIWSELGYFGVLWQVFSPNEAFILVIYQSCFWKNCFNLLRWYRHNFIICTLTSKCEYKFIKKTLCLKLCFKNRITLKHP